MDMELRLDGPESLVLEVQQRLRDCIADVDPLPRFKTVAGWLMDELEKDPAPFSDFRGVCGDSIPLVRGPSRSMGRGPQT
jgi:hypothetical protein